MKDKSTKQESQKSRRAFLKSIGVSIAGISLLPTTLVARGNFSSGMSAPAINPGAEGIAQTDGILPQGVSAVWDISKAFHETTPTRERISINGLWKWQPGTPQSDELPGANWGYFKVPGCWPGITDYMQKESQILYIHPSWKDRSINKLGVAWYQRELSIPKNWTNRHITLGVDYLNSSAVVYIDGVRLGEMLFPSGEMDLTAVCSPGKTYIISMKVHCSPFE